MHAAIKLNMLVVLRVFMVSSSLINCKAPEFYCGISMGLSYYAHRIVCQTIWSVLGIRVDGLGLRLYLVYLI
jgi:hypothetical protein